MACTVVSGNKGFTLGHLTDELFQHILMNIDSTAKLSGWKKVDFNTKYGTASTMQNDSRIVGFLAVEIYNYLPHSDQIQTKKIIFKSKVRGCDTLSYLSGLNPELGEEGKHAWRKLLEGRGFIDIHLNELKHVQRRDLHPVMPDIYWCLVDEDKDIFVFAMEFISPENFTHTDTLHTESWNEESISKVIRGLAFMHATYFGKCGVDSTVDCKEYFDSTSESKLSLDDILMNRRVLLEKCQTIYPDLLSKNQYSVTFKLLENFKLLYKEMENYPNTLIHRDVSLLNLCLRKDPKPNNEYLCLYDWDTACIGPPQIDLTAFLSYSLAENATENVWNKYINLYISEMKSQLLKRRLGSPELNNHCLDVDEFQKVFDICMIENFLRYLLVYCGMGVLSTFGPVITRVNSVRIHYILSAAKRNKFLSEILGELPCF